MKEDLLKDLIRDLSAQTGLSEDQTAHMLKDALRQQGYPVFVYFQTAWDAERWMSFSACANAMAVMNQAEPELYYEWYQWRERR